MLSRVTILPLLAVAILHSGPVAGQSDVAFPKEVYAARRARLLERIEPDAAHSIVIVPGRYLIGQYDHVRQDPHFWYLTGVESPYAILVMVPGGVARREEAGDRARLRRAENPSAVAPAQTVLFLPEKYQFAGGQYPMLDEAFRRAIWNRPIRRLSPGREASMATGVSETYAVDQFPEKLRELARNRNVVYLPLDTVKQYAPSGMDAPLSSEQQFARAVAELLPGRELRDVSPTLRRMRLVKDAHEIAALRKAAEISAQGMIAAMQQVRPGMNDRELAGLMEYHWKRLGSPRASFAPIVASGENAMTFFSVRGENYNAVDRVMRAGDLVFVDYGAAEYLTYKADLCRTWPVNGKFTAEQRTYYDMVLEAQEAAIARIRPGAMMLEAIEAAAQVFRKHGLEPFEDLARMGEDKVWGIMPSPTHYLARGAGIVSYTPMGRGVRDLGHHIGLEVQDSRDYSLPLEAGMVITIEPKIYIPKKNIAIMIEDMILVTPAGHENLSALLPKRAEDIERAMSRRNR
jgi:Xaa-Pro aminopeptidase